MLVGNGSDASRYVMRGSGGVSKLCNLLVDCGGGGGDGGGDGDGVVNISMQ